MADQQTDVNSPVTLKATIRGRVQGVGFRIFVWDAAQELGLGGYVRNLPDGNVYVLAVGKRTSLERLLSLLREGPSMARVSSVEHEWVTDGPPQASSHFEVRH